MTDPMKSAAKEWTPDLAKKIESKQERKKNKNKKPEDADLD